MAAMSDAVLRSIQARPPDTRLVVLCDFDGTLAPFHADPEVPRLPARATVALARLLEGGHAEVGLVSGRRLDDLRARAPLPDGAYLAGLHGLEIAVGAQAWRHPALDRLDVPLDEIARRIRQAARGEPGFVLEDKGASLALHVRGVEASRRQAVLDATEAVLDPWLDAGALRRLVGSNVREYLPAVPWHKGDAVRWIAHDVTRRTGQVAWCVYLGDDVTDEDAFRAIEHGVGVVVGERPSAARFRVPGPPAALALLEGLALLLDPAFAAEGVL
jgi:trehalose 6-phosphate phosphatase